jgi:hypothetical protein
VPRRKKPGETPKEEPKVAPPAPPQAQPEKPTERPVEKFTIREATWEEFERFVPTSRKERPKSLARQAFEMAASGKVVKLEGLSPAQVRAIVAAINLWNYREGNPVQVKYDVKAGVVYLAPAKKPEEKKQ